MLYLLNSAVISAEGTYSATKISRDEFVCILKRHCNNFISMIGYTQTAEHIHKISGIMPEISRRKVVPQSGDELLVCKLAYRIPDPSIKGKRVPESWEYWHIKYKSF